jgi:hypothetical protein
MAQYKFALKLHQDSAGDDNALAKITIGGTVVAESLEISATSATLYTYDVTSDTDPNADGTQTIPVKVQLLNDYYVDDDNDRNIIWTACGYTKQDNDGNYYKQTFTTTDNWETSSSSAPEVISDFTQDASFNWASASAYTGDENGTIDATQGWYPMKISTDNVEVEVAIKESVSKSYISN